MNIILLLFAIVHPFHVGLTEIEHNPESQTLQISIKLFSDDLEDALKKDSRESFDILNPKSEEKVDSLLKTYIANRFEVLHKQETLKLNYVGNERNYDVTWIYFESSPIGSLSQLELRNQLLFELFDDQTHVVHFTNNQGELFTGLIHQTDPVLELE